MDRDRGVVRDQLHGEGSPVVTVQFVRHLDHDFNRPVNEGGFHEVVLDKYVEPPKPGDIVDVGDSALRQRGRVRCLVAIVEPVGDYRDV